ncbi:MAG: hypothetical protein RI897_1052 [Verrucomicrobiota bacterium]|jgi:hypothetical protein
MTRTMQLWLSLLLLTAPPACAQDAAPWDWEYLNWSAFDDNGQQYVVEKTSVARITLGELTFWAPQMHSVPSRLTQRFAFTNSIAEASLQIPIIQVGRNANNESGSISVWASRNGTDWEQLLDAPPPPLPQLHQLVAVSHTYSYNQTLPPHLTGTRELWLQIRMTTTGDPLLCRFHQHRSGSNTTIPLALKVRFAPEAPALHNTHTNTQSRPRRATALADVVFGSLAGITLQDGGQGYTAPPKVLLPCTAPDGTPAIIESEILNGQITQLRIMESGSGYSTSPPLFISAPAFAPVAVEIGQRYQLQHTTDMIHWKPAGEPFTATQTEIIQEFEVDPEGRIYQLRPAHTETTAR